MAAAPVVDAGNDLATRVSRLEAQLQSRSRLQLQMQQQLNQLQDDLSSLRGQSEEHDHKLQQILERQREIYKELAKLEASGSQPAANTSATPAATTGTAVQADGDSYSSNLSENDAYDQAVNLVLKDKNYAKATAAFKQFIKQFPKSSYSDNAHYWLGQLLYSSQQLADAAKAFAVVVNQYPNSSKRADAMLKLGIIAKEQGNKADARSYFEKVAKEYPDSTSAKLAKGRLAGL